MAKIAHPIPKSRFELLRDNIGAILSLELKNQADLLADASINATVWNSRMLQFDKSECPAINVLHSRSVFDNKDRLDVDNECTIYIDVYTRNHSPDSETDNASLLVRDRISGIVRYILEHPEYKNFGFAPPFAVTSIVQDIQNSDPGLIQETDYLSMARLTLTAKIFESVQPLAPAQLQSHLTNVRLAQTDKGFVYELINN